MLSSKFAAFNYRFPFSSYCYYRDCLSLTRALSLSHVHTRSSDETQLTFTSRVSLNVSQFHLLSCLIFNMAINIITAPTCESQALSAN